jgi:hypothetical protein
MRKKKEMDKNTEIAGKLTIGDWLRLKESLERDFDKDTLWDQAYAFFEERISTRYLKLSVMGSGLGY